MPPRQQLLWADDDGKERFLYEEFQLRKAGWSVHWAVDAWQTARALSATPFDVLLLDQMLPFDQDSAQDLQAAAVWGGCLLLYWLRGRRPPAHVPAVGDFARLYEIEPLAENRGLAVHAVSAFRDDEIRAALQAASPLDAGLRFLPKPIDLERLLKLLPSPGR